MKIAVVTDDERSICQHFGPACYYVVYTIEGTEIVAREIREKGTHIEDALGRQDAMIAAIRDCTAVLVGNVSLGSTIALEEAGIIPIATPFNNVQEAVQAFMEGAPIPGV